jgi:hypothetical protein
VLGGSLPEVGSHVCRADIHHRASLFTIFEHPDQIRFLLHLGCLFLGPQFLHLGRLLLGPQFLNLGRLLPGPQLRVPPITQVFVHGARHRLCYVVN